MALRRALSAVCVSAARSRAPAAASAAPRAWAALTAPSGATGRGLVAAWAAPGVPFAASAALHGSAGAGASSDAPSAETAQREALARKEAALAAQAAQLAAASERVRAALEQMDALVAATGGKPGELAQKVQAEEEAEDAADDAADAKAHRRSRAIKWLGLTGLLAHWCIFARLTYWELSWDVMEPAAFLVGQAWIIVSYVYFMATKSEFSNEDLDRRVRRAFRHDAARLRALQAAAKRA